MGKPSPPKPPDPKKTAAAQTGTNVSTAISNAVLQNPTQYTPYGDLEYSFGGTPDYSGVPEIETVTTPGTQERDFVRTGGEGAGFHRDVGIAPKTQYTVGDNTFSSLDEANAYRQQQASGDENYTWTDPFTNETYTIPRVTVNQTLTDEQQQMLDNNNQAGINMSQIASDQSARIGELLNTPFSLDSLPEREQFDASRAPEMDRVGSGPELQGSVNPTLGIQGQIAGSGPIQTGVQGAQGYTRNVNAGPVQTGIGNAGDVQRSFDGGGPIQNSANMQGVRDVSSGADVPRIDYNRSDLGGIQGSLDPAGDITRTYGGDFSAERNRVENALMERMSPQLDRRMEQLESRLASQGLRVGSEPYQAAMDDYYRSTNDAQLGAILSAGQEQSRLNDMEARRAGFENAAQQQAFSQNLTAGQFANQAQAQGAGQTLQQDQMGMNAQQANADIMRAFQGLGVNRDVAAGNQALQGAQFANQAQGQQFGQNATQAEFGNQSQQQLFNQLLQGGQFANQAQAQEFGQGAANANLNNSAINDQFANDLSAGQFVNQAQGQQFGQNAARAEFGNNAANQELQRMLTQAGFANDAAQQGFQNQQDMTSQNNAAGQQEYQNYLQGLQAQNAQRSGTIEEAFAERNQPLNEIAALTSGSQVQNPQFTNANIAGIPTTDVAGLINENYRQRQQNYQSEMQNRNDLMGGLLGLGGSLGGAALGNPALMKGLL